VKDIEWSLFVFERAKFREYMHKAENHCLSSSLVLCDSILSIDCKKALQHSKKFIWQLVPPQCLWVVTKIGRQIELKTLYLTHKFRKISIFFSESFPRLTIFRYFTSCTKLIIQWREHYKRVDGFNSKFETDSIAKLPIEKSGSKNNFERCSVVELYRNKLKVKLLTLLTFSYSKLCSFNQKKVQIDSILVCSEMSLDIFPKTFAPLSCIKISFDIQL